MAARFIHRELDKTRKRILSLGALVEDRFRLATEAIQDLDTRIAEEIIRKDIEVDNLEVEIEEECLKVLALYQPVAGDLRFMIAVIKINNDLERIGDQAVNIAQRVLSIARGSGMPFPFDFTKMSDISRRMLKLALDAFVNMDSDLAEDVRRMDDAVDEMKRECYDIVKQAIRENPDHVGRLINLLLISRHLERIADHATNVAEEVIHMIEGDIVRHSAAGRPL